jgi:hypothetical protein
MSLNVPIIDDVAFPTVVQHANLDGSTIQALMISRLRANIAPQYKSFQTQCNDNLNLQNNYSSQSSVATRIVSPAASPPDIRGLELLSSASIISESSHSGTISSLAASTSARKETKSARTKKGRVYIADDIREDDVLCGRGGRSNNHPGNKRYRQVVNDFRIMYQNTEAKTVKTDLSRAIVEHCCFYGARFLKTDNASGRYFVLTKAEARKKTSQALRETKDLKWTSPVIDNQP